ncbi:3-oxoacyl-(acyl-carrier-protein) reductase FabG [Thiomonas sp. X19]|uniref:SDR family NAD(P)-dependent oxidoreductase n=1 Tax=Thiomonas sp. X19 TaxID=1050370 RepID=UPI000B6AB7F8|nr:glucose 1-dehydrogenase [Thiomonas sp. X19]SCC91160.1 3-oxoacyl-(acyl-carrier-protein) reductase FabG [Thiomonas sp. X19]
MRDDDFTGRTALVTGAATGIGRAMAVAMADAGATVIVNHLGRAELADETVALIEAAGGSAWAVEADVSQGVAVRGMMDACLRRHGGVDILVNNAGILLEKPFLDISEAQWDHVLATDLKSVFLCCQAALPAMLSRGNGCIINVASELGYLGRAGFTAYTAAKAGVITLTRSLAREFAPRVRINAIAPGPVDTPMLGLEQMSAAWAAKEADVPMGRVGRPEEIAATAVFLASAHASYYCGQTLSPNGGALMA